mmetsp:Transcript_91885/g.239535  ORF Transcript_91885/g.239535 Transcript_91885/m.239535 type:complete len:308 (+) Transcript_91885:348-1271(+)
MGAIPRRPVLVALPDPRHAAHGDGVQRHEAARHLLHVATGDAGQALPRLPRRRLGRASRPVRVERLDAAARPCGPPLAGVPQPPARLRLGRRRLRAAQRGPRDAHPGGLQPSRLHPERRRQFLLGRHQHQVRRVARFLVRFHQPVEESVRGRLHGTRHRRQAVAWCAREPRLWRLHVREWLGPGHPLHVDAGRAEHEPLGDARAVLPVQGQLSRLLDRLLLRRHERLGHLAAARGGAPQPVLPQPQPPEHRGLLRPRGPGLHGGVPRLVQEPVEGECRVDGQHHVAVAGGLADSGDALPARGRVGRR